MPKGLQGFQKGHKDLVPKEGRKRQGLKITGENNPSKKAWVREKISEKKRGIATRGTGWKQSEETKRKIGLANSIALKGKKLSKETKKKISEKMKGKTHTKEVKQRLREWNINNPNRKFKDTSIELRMEIELLRRNINYQKQVPLCKIAIVDFYLPEHRIVIQCDGCFYHGCPIHNPNYIKNKERDERQDKVLTFNGFNVYRFWEHEINKSVEKCINKIFK